jgi:hypothetical protein
MSCPAKREIRARGTIHICGGLGVGGARSQPLIHTPVAAALGRRHTSGERNYVHMHNVCIRLGLLPDQGFFLGPITDYCGSRT